MRSPTAKTCDSIRNESSAARLYRFYGLAPQFLAATDEFTVVEHCKFLDNWELIKIQLLVFRTFGVVILMLRGKFFDDF